MMPAGGSPKDAEPGTGGLSGPQRDAVRQELDRILTSAAFRGSKRCREFLGHIVTQTLEGKGDLLKERLIGVEVFDRDAGYDTGDDSIVRVKANEVRKRLAQFYNEAGSGSAVQIDLPPGSYIPEFRWAQAATPPSSPSRKPLNIRRALPVAVAVLVICAAGLWLWLGSRGDALQQFWAPFFRDPRPVLICVAHPVVYRLTQEPRDTPLELVPFNAFERDPDHFVGIGDALALARFSMYLAKAGKPSEMRIGTDTSFTDLRNAPAVLIGAYSNRWTMELTKDFRFTFASENGESVVRDQMSPGHRWAAGSTPASDFAIVSRVFRSKTGEPVIIAAGLGHFGTQVAGEFLTNAEFLEEAMRSAPADWRSRNLQIVLRADVIGRTPGPPKALAIHSW